MMNRRELIKSLAVSGTLIGSAGLMLNEKHESKLHIIGVGSGGTSVMVDFYERGVNARFSCITGSRVAHLKPKMEHVYFEPDIYARIELLTSCERIALTDRMKALFDGDDCHVIVAGLGAFIGTGLISDLLGYLQTENKNYLVVCTLPFLMEGRKRRNYALSKKAEIENMKNVHFVDMQSIREHWGDMSIRTAFAMANTGVYEVVKQNLSVKTQFNESLA